MKIILIISITCLFVSLTLASCVIENDRIERKNRPKFTRNFGSRTIEHSYYESEITFSEDESLMGFCSTGFSQSNTNSKDFECRSDGIFYQRDQYHYRNEINYDYIKCNDLEFNVFESVTPFSWCNSEKNLGSFIVAAKNIYPATSVAELCFDYEKMIPSSIKYFSFSKHYQDHNNLTMLRDLFENEISEKKIFYQSVLPPKSSPKTRKLFNGYWPEIENFMYSPLVQNGIYVDLKSLGELMEILWWNNLRVGNWKRYVNALVSQSVYSTYKIYAGTFGVLSVPEDLAASRRLEEMRVYSENETIPLYIWNVVQEIDGPEEFVIFGFNSPYSDFLSKNDVELCESICGEISWLKNVHNLFDSSLLGKMFCCTLEEASHFGIINGISILQSSMGQLPLIDATLSDPSNNTIDSL